MLYKYINKEHLSQINREALSMDRASTGILENNKVMRIKRDHRVVTGPVIFFVYRNIDRA